MCKHVAAVLYGIGARLDAQPELIFTLRRVDAKELVTQAGAGLQKPRRTPTAGKVLDDALVSDVFGIELADAAPATKPVAARRRSTPAQVTRAPTPSATATARKAPVAGKTKAAGKTAQAKVPGGPSARARKSTAGKAKTRVATAAVTGNAPTARRVSARAAKKKSR